MDLLNKTNGFVSKNRQIKMFYLAEKPWKADGFRIVYY